MSIHGIHYKSGTVIRMQNETGFEYCIIEEILIYNDEKIFITKSLQLEGYDGKLCAFHVSATGIEKVVLFKDFYCHGILHLKNKSGKLYIVEKDNRYRSIWCL